MKLGLELVAARPATPRLGTFFETWLAAPDGTIRRSLGRDEYHLALAIGCGRRLAATGRTHVCQLDLEAAEIGANQARPPLLTPAEVVPGSPVIWAVRTNLFLDLAALTDACMGRLTRDSEPPREFPLDASPVVATEVAPGRYTFDISGLLR